LSKIVTDFYRSQICCGCSFEQHQNIARLPVVTTYPDFRVGGRWKYWKEHVAIPFKAFDVVGNSSWLEGLRGAATVILSHDSVVA
jgi:hypothetical protein